MQELNPEILAFSFVDLHGADVAGDIDDAATRSPEEHGPCQIPKAQGE